jgi:hypothetical protein
MSQNCEDGPRCSNGSEPGSNPIFPRRLPVAARIRHLEFLHFWPFREGHIRNDPGGI